jgi:hypothetical protein
MKYLLLIMLLVSSVAGADEKIIRRKNGRDVEYDPKDYVIVPRRKKKPMTSAPKPEVQKVAEKEIRVYQKNHARLLGGVGPTGISTLRVGDTLYMSENYNPVVGIAYGRNVSERWSVEGEALTNSTLLLGVGYNW